MSETRGRWSRFYDKVFQGKTAVWTAIFTGVLAVFTILLFRVSNDSRTDNVGTQRAFISMVAVGGQPLSTPDGSKLIAIRMFPTWQNSGTTPAKEAISQVSWEVWPSDLPEGFTFPDQSKRERRKFVLGPKAGSSMFMDPMSIDQFKDVKDGKFRLFVWGWVKYNDIFAGTPTRLTEFCTEIVSISATKADMTDPANSFNWSGNNCRDFNCFDESCVDYKTRINAKE